MQLRPRMTLTPSGAEEIEVKSDGDADWAGCRSTRKSTTGAVVQFLGGTVQHCSRTQATVAFSSCEAEMYGTGTALA